MDNLYKTLQELCEKKGVSGGKMCTDIGLSRSFMTELKKGRAKGITSATAQKLSEYFDCDINLLFSGEPQPEENKKITKEQLKFALFNGDKDISDKMLEDVLNFAEFIKQNRDNK